MPAWPKTATPLSPTLLPRLYSPLDQTGAPLNRIDLERARLPHFSIFRVHWAIKHTQDVCAVRTPPGNC